MISEREVDREGMAKERAPGRRMRNILEPFGVDAISAFPLGSNTCVERDCKRRALVGELVCPVHFGLATPAEMPDYLADAAARGRRIVRSFTTAIIMALIGFIIGAWISDPLFGWVGGLGAGLVVTAGLSRELRLYRLAGVLGLFGFLVATVLLVAAALVGVIDALPWIISRLL